MPLRHRALVPPEDDLELARVDADALVAHGEHRPSRLAGERHVDRLSVAVLDGVVHQVGHHLVEAQPVRLGLDALRGLERERRAGAVRLRLEPGHHLAHHRGQVDRLPLDGEAPRRDPGNVQQIRHQARQPGDLLAGGFGVPEHASGEGRWELGAGLAGQHVQLERERRERGPELVARDREERIPRGERVPERRGMPLLLVDVGGHPEPADVPALRVTEQLNPGEEPAEDTVGAAEGVLHLERLTGGEAVLPALEDGGEHLRVVHRLPAPALHHLRRGAGVLEPPAVDVVDEPVGPGGPGKPRHVLHHRPELPLALAKSQLGAPAVLDVDHAADVAHELARGVEARQRRGVEPAVLAVPAPQTVLGAKWDLHLVGGEIVGPDAVGLVGVHRGQPPEAEPGVARLPGVLEPLPVQVHAAAARVGHPEHDRRVVGHVPEPGLALLHLLSGLHLLGDVAPGDGDALVHPGDLEREPRPRGVQPLVGRIGELLLDDRLTGAPDLAVDVEEAALRCAGEDLGDEPPLVLVTRQPRVALGDCVHVLDLEVHRGAVRSQHRGEEGEGVQHALHRVAKAPLAPAERLLERALHGDVLRERHEAAHPSVRSEIRGVGGADQDGRGARPLELGLEGDGAALERGSDVGPDPGVHLVAHHLPEGLPQDVHPGAEVVRLVEAVAEEVTLVGVHVDQRGGHRVQDQPEGFEIPGRRSRARCPGSRGSCIEVRAPLGKRRHRGECGSSRVRGRPPRSEGAWRLLATRQSIPSPVRCRRGPGSVSSSSRDRRSAGTPSSAATAAAASIRPAPSASPSETWTRLPEAMSAPKSAGASRPPAAVPTA